MVRTDIPVTGNIPQGVVLKRLEPHEDARGSVTEMFRDSWDLGIEPVQWNATRSQAGVLRGVHVHLRHSDYLIVVSGRVTVGLRDLRTNSLTKGCVALFEVSADDMSGVLIPPGVAHGFYFYEPSMHIYGLSHFWDPNDDYACHWADPALGIPWPATDPTILPRDAAAPRLSELLDQIGPFLRLQ